MRVCAAILAAGAGTRFGRDKTLVTLGGKPLWMWSFETFASHPLVSDIILVGSENLAQLSSGSNVVCIEGGKSRLESSALAFAARPDQCDIFLVHDAARPFVSASVISEVIQAILEVGAAAPAVPVVDTIRQFQSDRVALVDRSQLIAMQTPQGGRCDLLAEAYQRASGTETDEMSMVERCGFSWRATTGDRKNFKVTEPDDYKRAQAMIGFEMRTGLGYDIHSFSDDPQRPMYLGGVLIPGAVGLEGHSDADVVLHAIADALLGAMGKGDIGYLFPPSDMKWKNVRSTVFLQKIAELLTGEGWIIANIDVAVVAEVPKIAPHANGMIEAIASALSIDRHRVNLKATTNERLGAIGRSEGIAAFATTLMQRSDG